MNFANIQHNYAKKSSSQNEMDSKNEANQMRKEEDSGISIESESED